MKKLFVITGEYSGDIHASKVVAALKSKYSELVVEGIGGENLKSAGVKLFSDQKKMGAVGLSPKIVIDHFTLGKRVVDYITKEFKPDLVLLIDYGVFNLNVSKFLKKAGIKVFYYIPPQVWASRKWRINTIKKNVDEVLCIFPFEKEKRNIRSDIPSSLWLQVVCVLRGNREIRILRDACKTAQYVVIGRIICSSFPYDCCRF